MSNISINDYGPESAKRIKVSISFESIVKKLYDNSFYMTNDICLICRA